MSKKREKEHQPIAEFIELTMRNGAKYTVTDSDGKYYYCGTTKFRKGNPNIESVETQSVYTADTHSYFSEE